MTNPSFRKREANEYAGYLAVSESQAPMNSPDIKSAAEGRREKEGAGDDAGLRNSSMTIVFTPVLCESQ